MSIKTLLHGKNSKYILSIILGLGLATLFRKVCKNGNCLIFKGANIEKIKDKVFKYDDKCYTYKENIKKCDNNKKMISFA
tara:strand:+ start:6697 stop:6936 length:240 start_codon:yes stop_codon:yes gene_type:complete